MKHLFYSLLVLLFSVTIINAYAQNKAVFVRYTVDRNSKKSIEDLLAKSFLCVYRVNPQRVKIEAKKDTNDLPYPQYGITPEQKFFKETRSNIIYFESRYKNKYCLVRDSLPQIHWQIINNPSENKIICGYTCKKASGYFRGSEITAYYTEAVPMPFGPWKFKDLPGLILQVYNVKGDRDFMWTASKVEYPYNGDLSFKFPKHLKVITQKEYINEQEQQWRDQMKKKNPNSSTDWDRVPLKRLGLEKTYEWEPKDNVEVFGIF